MARRPTDSTNWGGARPGSGPKRKPSPYRRVMVQLRPDQVQYLATIAGNRSQAVRLVIDEYRAIYGPVRDDVTALRDTDQE